MKGTEEVEECESRIEMCMLKGMQEGSYIDACKRKKVR